MAYSACMAKQKSSYFAGRLRELRELAELTQVQLAERAGLHISAVTRFEQGLREPSLATAAKLASALGVLVDDLLQPSTVRRVPAPRGRPSKATPTTPPAADLEATAKKNPGDRKLAKE